MPDPVESLTFDRVWTSKTDFPTYESNETQVRADMQYLYDVIQNFINAAIVPALNDIISGSYSPNSVDTAAIVDGAVTLAKLASNSVNASKIVDGTVGTAELASGAVTQAKLAKPSVGTPELIDLAVSTAKLATGAVTAAKLATDAVEEAKIKDNAVTTAKIKNANVTAAKLGSDILPKKVGFVIGTGNPVSNPGLLSNEQIYVKLES